MHFFRRLAASESCVHKSPKQRVREELIGLPQCGWRNHVLCGGRGQRPGARFRLFARINPTVMNLVAVSHWSFFTRLLEVFVINISLSRDNAVVIALAARKVPESMRNQALLVGVTFAVAVLVAATFLATRLLTVPYLRLAGGALILWIATNSLLSQSLSNCDPQPSNGNFRHAIYFVIVADLTMSLDNVLAVAGVAERDLMLIVLGLGLSIPLLAFGSGFLLTLMDRWPGLIYLSAAILGVVGGQIIMTDPYIVCLFQPGGLVRHSVEGSCALGVIGVGTLLRSKRQGSHAVRENAGPRHEESLRTGKPRRGA